MKDFSKQLIDFFAKLLAGEKVNVEFQDRVDQGQHAKNQVDIGRFQIFRDTQSIRPMTGFNVDIDTGNAVRGEEDATGRQSDRRFIADIFAGQVGSDIRH